MLMYYAVLHLFVIDINQILAVFVAVIPFSRQNFTKLDVLSSSAY